MERKEEKDILTKRRHLNIRNAGIKSVVKRVLYRRGHYE